MSPVLLLIAFGVAQVGPQPPASFPGGVPGTGFPGGAGLFGAPQGGAPQAGGVSDPLAALFGAPTVESSVPEDGPVRLTRLVDPVAWLDAEARAERHLYFYDKVADLEVGDGVRQGVAGTSELFFSDFTQVRQYGETRMWIERKTPTESTLRYEQADTLLVDVPAGSTLTVRLPGGYVMIASDLWFRVELGDMSREFQVKNSGPGELRVTGPTNADAAAALPPGNTVSLPIVEDPAAVRYRQDSRPRDVFAGLPVRLDSEQTSERSADGLWVRGAGTARIGGARIHLPPGEAIRLRRPTRVPGAEAEGG